MSTHINLLAARSFYADSPFWLVVPQRLAILPMIEVNQAHAAVTPDDDLFTERIIYPGINGDMQAYVARPKEEKKYATVVVIHENRGLNAHIEDVTRRAAKAGYLAIAPQCTFFIRRHTG